MDLVTLTKLYGGEETTVFASDWPHHDFDHPQGLQLPFSARRRFWRRNDACSR
jgi:predicted TIM-barrel fold metal-dependent hydrolase